MPVKSQAQRNLMEMVKHDPEKARKLGFKVSGKVARDFLQATPSLKNKDLPAHAGKKR